jgi:alkylation response protein AidB-like acyl-CoA dehydrogenase
MAVVVAAERDGKVPRVSSGLSAEQEELRHVLRQFLEAKSPESAVRAQMATDRGFDQAVWRQMSDQLGLPGLAIPESYGGSGFGPVELGVVLEEMGRALLCAPYFATVVLAANALLHCGDEQAKTDLLPGIASGDTIATLAVTEQARLDLDRVPGRLIGIEGAGGQIIEHVLDLAAVALAAEEVGGAQKVLEASVEYAKLRIQFGRPIGSFQAIKHKCADVLLAVETARSAAYYAARCAASGSDELPSVASLAKAYCSDAYVKAASENIQIHGGIGFTWEHPAHLYLKRAKSAQSMLGTSVYHRERLADHIGL